MFENIKSLDVMINKLNEQAKSFKFFSKEYSMADRRLREISEQIREGRVSEITMERYKKLLATVDNSVIEEEASQLASDSWIGQIIDDADHFLRSLISNVHARSN